MSLFLVLTSALGNNDYSPALTDEERCSEFGHSFCHSLPPTTQPLWSPLNISSAFPSQNLCFEPCDPTCLPSLLSTQTLALQGTLLWPPYCEHLRHACLLTCFRFASQCIVLLWFLSVFSVSAGTLFWSRLYPLPPPIT